MEIKYSQVSPGFLKVLLIERYKMSPATEVIFLHRGINDTYKITEVHKEYVLRIYRSNWKSKLDIVGELEMVSRLNQNGMNVSMPIADQENNFIQDLRFPEGTRQFVVFSYASGEALSSLDNGAAKLFGNHLAMAHQITERLHNDKLSKNYIPTWILAQTKEALEMRLGVGDEISLNILKKAEQKIIKKLSAETLKDLPQGLCHGDPHYENCFFDSDKEELTFFDFDFCGNGYLHYDLGSFFHYERNRPDIQTDFLNGYLEVRPETELSVIPYFLILMRIFHLGARAKNADGVKNPVWPVSEIERTLLEIDNQLTKLETSS